MTLTVTIQNTLSYALSRSRHFFQKLRAQIWIHLSTLAGIALTLHFIKEIFSKYTARKKYSLIINYFSKPTNKIFEYHINLIQNILTSSYNVKTEDMVEITNEINRFYNRDNATQKFSAQQILKVIEQKKNNHNYSDSLILLSSSALFAYSNYRLARRGAESILWLPATAVLSSLPILLSTIDFKALRQRH